MTNGTTPRSDTTEVANLATIAYQRFWETNQESVAAHRAGDWQTARRLNAAATAWLSRHQAFTIGSAA